MTTPAIHPITFPHDPNGHPMTPFIPRSESFPRGVSPPVPTRSDDQVVELHLLLPLWQAEALEAAARAQGMTTGQVLRRVIADALAEPVGAAD